MWSCICGVKNINSNVSCVDCGYRKDGEIPDLNHKLYRPYAVDKFTKEKYNIFLDLWENTLIISKRSRIQTGRYTTGKTRFKNVGGVFGYQRKKMDATFAKEFDTDRFEVLYVPDPSKYGYCMFVNCKGKPRRSIGERRRENVYIRKRAPERPGDSKYRNDHKKNPRFNSRQRTVFKESEVDFGKKVRRKK